MSYLTDFQSIGGYGAFAGPGCDIKTVQSQLNELGYNAGTVDGFLGKNTYTALQLFSIASGTPYVWGQQPSAELCGKLAEAVAQKHAPPPVAQPQPQTQPVPSPGPSAPAPQKPIYINPAILKALAVGKPKGLAGWWSAQSTPMKVAVVGGATAVLLGALYATGVIGGSRRATANQRRRSKKSPRCQTSMQVQSLIFPKRLGRRRARAWAKAHGYRSRKVDARGPSVRLRQFHPRAYRKGTFRTIAMGKSGIKAVIGCKKKGRARRAR